MENTNLIKEIVELAQKCQHKQTVDVLEFVKNIPESEEKKQLIEKLKVCDALIDAQCNYVLRLDGIARKYG